MDEQEERIFFDMEMEVFGERNSHYNVPLFQPTQLVSNFSIEKEGSQQKAVDYKNFRAYNPLDRLKDIPYQRQSQYLFMLNNNKRFNGIQHFFELGSEDKFTPEFLEYIEMDALGNSSDFKLDELFIDQRKKQNYKEELQKMITSLDKKIQEINQKVMQSVNINRTISNTFYEHFDNFEMVLQQTQFFHQFEKSAKNMVSNSKKLKGPGVDLIVSIYDFWMKSFKDFINEIWKYSSKFTLSFFKKEEHQEYSEQVVGSMEMKSESSNTINSKDKRKGWTNEQVSILEQLISSDVIFSQSVLKKLSTQFNRSISSISSKIQKINKSKKGSEENAQESLLKKTLEILRMHPQGLNRESIIQKMNENYEMGYGGQWEKSVGQLLSSRKEFIKAKSKHKLLNPQEYKKLDLTNCDHSKLTFRDKVIQVFLTCPNAEADLKTLVEYYSVYFKEEADSQERRKSIQSNISKTLSRYEIFGREAKTLYFVNPIYCKTQARNMQLQVDQFFQM